MAGLISAILAELFFAFAGIFYKFGIEAKINALTLVYGRLLTASVILLIAWGVQRLWQLTIPPLNLSVEKVPPKRRSPDGRDTLHFALLGIFFPASTLLLCVAIQYSSLATSNLLHNLTPVFIALISVFIFKKPSHFRMVAGLGITFFGLIVLELPELQADWTAFLSGGSAIAIVSALANAFHVLIVSRLKSRGYDNLTILFWMSALGALYLVPFMVGFGVDLLPHSAIGWELIGALGVFVQLIAQILVLKSLNQLSPEIAAAFFLLEPVMATGLAYFFFAERLTGFMVIGFTLILGGLLILCLPQRSPAPVFPQRLHAKPSR